jgi:hypothetical protein
MSGWSVTTGAEDANKTNKHREFQIQFEMEDFVHQAVILVVSSTLPPPPPLHYSLARFASGAFPISIVSVLATSRPRGQGTKSSADGPKRI